MTKRILIFASPLIFVFFVNCGGGGGPTTPAALAQAIPNAVGLTGPQLAAARQAIESAAQEVINACNSQIQSTATNIANSLAQCVATPVPLAPGSPVPPGYTGTANVPNPDGPAIANQGIAQIGQINQTCAQKLTQLRLTENTLDPNTSFQPGSPSYQWFENTLTSVGIQALPGASPSCLNAVAQVASNQAPQIMSGLPGYGPSPIAGASVVGGTVTGGVNPLGGPTITTIGSQNGLVYGSGSITSTTSGGILPTTGGILPYQGPSSTGVYGAPYGALSSGAVNDLANLSTVPGNNPFGTVPSNPLGLGF